MAHHQSIPMEYNPTVFQNVIQRSQNSCWNHFLNFVRRPIHISKIHKNCPIWPVSMVRENGIRPLNCGDAHACICVDVNGSSGLSSSLSIRIYSDLPAVEQHHIPSFFQPLPPADLKSPLPDLYYTRPIIRRLSYAIWTSQETNSFYSSNCVSHSSIFFVYFATNIPVFNISTN